MADGHGGITRASLGDANTMLIERRIPKIADWTSIARSMAGLEICFLFEYFYKVYRMYKSFNGGKSCR